MMKKDGMEIGRREEGAGRREGIEGEGRDTGCLHLQRWLRHIETRGTVVLAFLSAKSYWSPLLCWDDNVLKSGQRFHDV